MKEKWTEIFQTTPHYLRQQAKLTCGDNPLYALVELITNSEEAYKHLDRKGIKHRGLIIIDVFPHNKKSKYVVTDYALGLDEKDLEAKVQKIGGDQSDLTEETGGRSFYGRGLKEALINFGYGKIISIKNGKLFRAESKDVELTYEGERNVYDVDRKELGVLSSENCVSISLIAVNSHIQRTPQFENLKLQLIKYFELRDILQNDKREIILRYHRQNGPEEEKLVYKPIRANKIEEKTFKLSEIPEAEINLEIYEAEEDIPAVQDKFLSERGFLICSKNAIHAIENFGFDYHVASARIFGRIKSDYIDFLLRTKKEALFDPTRSGGVIKKQYFIKELYREITKILIPFYEKISSEMGGINEIKDKETDDNISKALNYFNKIAKDLIDDIDDIDGAEDPLIKKKKRKKKEDLPPPDGFNFMPPYIQAIVNKPASVTLKLSKDFEKIKDKLAIYSENKNIVILKDREKGWEFNEKGFWVFRTVIEGKNVGDYSNLIASIGTMKTKMIVEIKEEKRGKGLFSNFAIESGLPPEQRAQYIRGTGKIVISADSPSVKPYINKINKLRSVETRLLISELILGACCGEIARQMILRGKEPLLRTDPDAIAEQVHDLLVRLTNKHARATQLLVIKGKLEEHVNV